MSDRRSLSRETLAELVTRLGEISWPWTAEDVDRIADDVGWVVQERRPRTIMLGTEPAMATGDVGWDHAHPPEFHFSVVQATFVNDLLRLPRDEDSIPDRLRQRLRETEV